MTTFARTDVNLIVGGPLPTETIGAPGFTEILTPASFTGTSNWITEGGGQSLTLGNNWSAGNYQGYASVLTKGDNAAGDNAGKAFFPAAFVPPAKGFTVQFITYLAAPTAYVWEFGQYKLASLGGAFRLEHLAQTTSLSVPNAASAYSILARCDGTNTRLMAGTASVGAGTIDATPIANARCWVGRTSSYAAGTHVFRLAYAPRALSDTEMSAVQSTALNRYPFLTA